MMIKPGIPGEIRYYGKYSGLSEIEFETFN